MRFRLQKYIIDTKIRKTFLIIKFLIFIVLVFFFWRTMIYLVVFNIKLLWKWNSMRQFRMRIVLIIHFKSFQVRQQKLRPLFYHHLTSGHLFGITTFTKELIIEIQKFFSTKLFKTITEWNIGFNINRKCIKLFLT
jgi:hypothetical protein